MYICVCVHVCVHVHINAHPPPHTHTHTQCIDRDGLEFLSLVRARILLQEDGRVAAGAFSAQPLPPSHHLVTGSQESEGGGGSSGSSGSGGSGGSEEGEGEVSSGFCACMCV